MNLFKKTNLKEEPILLNIHWEIKQLQWRLDNPPEFKVGDNVLILGFRDHKGKRPPDRKAIVTKVVLANEATWRRGEFRNIYYTFDGRESGEYLRVGLALDSDVTSRAKKASDRLKENDE